MTKQTLLLIIVIMSMFLSCQKILVIKAVDTHTLTPVFSFWDDGIFFSEQRVVKIDAIRVEETDKDGTLRVVWEIRNNPQELIDSPAVKTHKYGNVPKGFIVKTEASELEWGRTYNVSAKITDVFDESVSYARGSIVINDR